MERVLGKGGPGRGRKQVRHITPEAPYGEGTSSIRTPTVQ